MHYILSAGLNRLDIRITFWSVTQDKKFQSIMYYIKVIDLL